MIYTIFSYWNSTELAGVFNAASALVNSSDYGGALKFMVLIAILSLAMTVLAGKAKMEEFWQWTIMVALFNGMLLAPKATVQIVDVTGTKPPVVVSNVPIGMAALAGGVSTIGHWMTTSYETVFALPNSLTFENNGMVFGQKVQQEINMLKPATIAWTNDYNNFYRECLAPDILSGTISQDQINSTSDIWSLFNNTNPGLFVTLSTGGTMSCPNAYTNLDTRLTTSEIPATLQRFGLSLYPQAGTPALAKSLISNAIVDSNSYFNGIAVGANAAVKQGVISNATIDAHCNMLAQTSNTALAAECLTQSEGFRQTNSSYMAMANIAQSSMPKLHNAIELIQYAIFPIVLIFVIMAGHHGMTVLKTYVMSLMWIQLWPPLYAVTNYMMNVHATYWATSTQGNAMALQYQQWISTSSVSDQAIAGMLTLSIPAIAAAIIKGGDIGAQAVGSMISPPSSVEKLAVQMTEGNFNNGQFNTSPSINTGSSAHNIRGADGSSINIAANGNQTYDKGITADNMGWKAEGSQAYAAKLSDGAAKSHANSISAGQSASKEMTAMFGEMDALAQTRGRGLASGSSSNSTNMSNFSKSYAKVQGSIASYAKKHGITQTKATEIIAAATAGTPGAGLLGSSASITMNGKSNSQESIMAEEADSIAKSSSFTNQVSAAQTAARALTFETKDSAGAEAAHRIDSSRSNSAKYQETASNESRRSEELAHKAELVRSAGVAVTNDLTTAVVNSIMEQSRDPKGKGLTFGGQTYHNMKADEIDAIMRTGDPDMQSLVAATAENIMDKRIKRLVAGQMTTDAALDAAHATDSQKFKGKGVATVNAAAAENTGKTQAAQKGAGVVVGTNPTDHVTGTVNKQLAAADLQATPSAETLAANKAFVDGVSGKIEKTSMLAAAVENAGSSVMPSATSYLIDKAIPGQASGDFFNQEKDKFHGSTGQAVFETAEFLVSTAFMATKVGGLAEGVAVKEAEVLAGKAVEKGEAKLVAEEGLAKAKQGLAEAQSGLAERQAEFKAADTKFGETSGKRWSQSDTVAQQQYEVDRQAVTTARENLNTSEMHLVEAQKRSPAAQQGATDATNAASDASHAATQARRAVPDVKSTSQALGGAVVAVGSKEIHDHLDGSRSNKPAAPSAARAEPAKVEPAAQPAAHQAARVEPAAPSAARAEPAKVEPAAQPAAHQAARVEPAAPSAARAEPAKVEPAAQPAAAAPAPAPAAQLAAASAEPFAGSPGKSMLGELFSSGQGHVPQYHAEQNSDSGNKNGDMPPPQS